MVKNNTQITTTWLYMHCTCLLTAGMSSWRVSLRMSLSVLVAVLVVSVLLLGSKFTIFACSAKMGGGLLNHFPLSTGTVLRSLGEGMGNTAGGEGLPPSSSSLCVGLSPSSRLLQWAAASSTLQCPRTSFGHLPTKLSHLP